MKEQDILPDFLDTVKQADYYYEFCDDLREWNQAKKTYDSAIYTLKYLPRDLREELIDKYVPDVIKSKVREDIAR